MNRHSGELGLMTLRMNRFKAWAPCLYLVLVAIAVAADKERNEHDGEDAGDAIVMTADERVTAGVIVDRVIPRTLNETLRVPAEVVINAYKSARVTPRITAQVVARHVHLGDRVEAGQSLVTLSSVEMAAAQGALIVADREWRRVETLGRQTVSERRYTEAQVARQQALAKVVAYGMTEAQASVLMKSGNASKATGAFYLLAPQAGTVLQDDFIVGELIEPGRVLIDITDESLMWVEARIVPNTLPEIEAGAAARVSVDGVTWVKGKVIQQHHRFDETTRTRGLRIEVENVDDRLHPGQFVEAELVTFTNAPVLAVPLEAVTMIDGLPTVFKLVESREFQIETIDAGPTIGDWVVVLAGLKDGDEIAVSGVFHLKSLMLKSSLGQGHTH